VKLNRGGLICAGIYAGFLLLALTGAFLAHDDKGRWFFMMLGSIPGGIVFAALPEAALEWFLANCYPLLVIGPYVLSFAIAYLSGWAFEKIVLSIAPRLNRLDERLLDQVRGEDR
jgi:hypothetical protein